MQKLMLLKPSTRFYLLTERRVLVKAGTQHKEKTKPFPEYFFSCDYGENMVKRDVFVQI